MLTTADAIHMGYGRKRYVFRRRDMSITSELSVECDATAVASGGRYTLTGLSNGAVQQHTSSGTCRILRGHKSAVTSLCTFEDRILASGSRDKTIRLRRLCDRRTQAILRGHDSAVEWTAVCEGRLATHGGCDGRAKLWDVTKGVCVTTGRPIQRATISRGVCHNGTIYVAIRNAVYVLDARMGLATACVLSMPRGSGWRDCDMSALRMCSDGTLLAGVGGGGVAVWDARGGWVARGLGWPRRWEEKKRMLRAVEMNGRTIVAGGDMGELLTFGRDGEYEGFVADDGVRRSGVSAIVGGEGKWLIARADGRVDVARVEEGVADWNVVAGVQEGSKSRFWDA